MEETSSEEPAAPPAARGGPPIVVLAILGLNLAVSGFTLFQVMGKAHARTAAAAPAPGPPRREVVGPLVTIDPFVVNLDEPGNPRYLKIQLQVEMLDGAATRLFEKNKTLIRDELLGYLSGLKLESTLGADNKQKIRAELERRVGDLVGDGRVRRIVFVEFVVQ